MIDATKAAATEEVKKQRMLNGLRDMLSSLKGLRIGEKQAAEASKEYAAQIKPLLEDVDGLNGGGVRFEFEGVEYAALVCQPDAGKIWDAAPLIEHLKQSPALWRKVSTTVLDPMKLEAEMAAGNINREELLKFQIPDKLKASYIKFVNAKPESQ